MVGTVMLLDEPLELLISVSIPISQVKDNDFVRKQLVEEFFR